MTEDKVIRPLAVWALLVADLIIARESVKGFEDVVLGLMLTPELAEFCERPFWPSIVAKVGASCHHYAVRIGVRQSHNLILVSLVIEGCFRD